MSNDKFPPYRHWEVFWPDDVWLEYEERTSCTGSRTESVLHVWRILRVFIRYAYVWHKWIEESESNWKSIITYVVCLFLSLWLQYYMALWCVCEQQKPLIQAVRAIIQGSSRQKWPARRRSASREQNTENLVSLSLTHIDSRIYAESERRRAANLLCASSTNFY